METRTQMRLRLLAWMMRGLGWVVLGLGASEACAGWYVGSHVKWASFAARPQAAEATPNYYGYGLGLNGGYSISQILDLGVVASYLPGNRQAAKIGSPQAELSLYGAELALRFAQAVYLGVSGGLTQYNMATARKTRPEELTGIWDGKAIALAVGGIAPLDRENYLQTTLELWHTTMESRRDDAAGQRKLDAFALTFGYTFNDFKSKLFEGTPLGDFIKSINFF